MVVTATVTIQEIANGHRTYLYGLPEEGPVSLTTRGLEEQVREDRMF